MRKILSFLACYAGIPFIASLLAAIAMLFGVNELASLIIVPAMTIVFYILLRKKMNMKTAAWMNGILVILPLIFFTIVMVFSSGNMYSSMMVAFYITVFPFFPAIFFMSLMGANEVIFIMVFLTYLLAYLLCSRLAGNKLKVRKLCIPVILVALCMGISGYMYINRPQAKYAGHGFAYMNGYSSTDFKDYMVYSKNSKLATLDHEASLRIEKEEDMPVLDGAEACYPLYAALAKAVYKDIDVIEKNWMEEEDNLLVNGKIVTFTNSIRAFDRLIYKEHNDYFQFEGSTDLFFGARPSQEQMQEAKEAGVDLDITPIGREAFVFFVEDDNPVTNLTSEQVKAIYHGDITNWKELGGPDQEIVAFQRPRNSGSQTMMEYFMGDISLKEPMTYEMVDSMTGVIKEVAQYHNEKGAIGYTFRYFLEGLQQEKNVKLLSVDGVYPSRENIENGSYPLNTSLCLISRKDDPNPYVQKMIDFILSEDGQTIVRETGYAGFGE